MSITTTKSVYSNGSYVAGHEATTTFEGRVIKVNKFSARRNMSDTMDYTDFQSVECVEALVWLGTHGQPPMLSGKPWVRGSYDTTPARELEYWEQFAWVECSNHFVWRGCDRHDAEVDAEINTSGDPLMWVNYIAYEGWQKANAEASVREEQVRFEAARAETQRRASVKAARTAKDLSKRDEVAKQLITAPKNGDRVTVGAVTGKIFWTGVTKFYGKWSARAGVKDATGTAHWCEITECIPVK